MYACTLPALNFLTYRHPDVDVDVAMDGLSSSACIQRQQLPVERASFLLNNQIFDCYNSRYISHRSWNDEYLPSVSIY